MASGAAGGKRAGARRGPRRGATFQPALLLLASGVTVCLVAWGYLVYAAIDFGSSARGGSPQAWGFLALASLGAVACLFIGLMLVARILRRLGIIRGPERPAVPAPRQEQAPRTVPTRSRTEGRLPDRPVGGHRAAR